MLVLLYYLLLKPEAEGFPESGPSKDFRWAAAKLALGTTSRRFRRS